MSVEEGYSANKFERKAKDISPPTTEWRGLLLTKLSTCQEEKQLYCVIQKRRIVRVFFVLVDSHTSLAVIRRFTVIEGGAMSHFRLSIPVQGIIPVVETERNDVIFVENIQQKCLCLDISPSCKCVATFPNAIMCD